MLINDQLKIWQNNLHKSEERTHSILSDPDMKQYAILLLQEQYWSAYTKSSPIHHTWAMFEPTAASNREPRAVIYVNKNVLDVAYVTPILLPFSDATAIQITAPDSKPVLILNIYNPCDGSIIPQLHNYLREELNVRDYETIIMAGDFNCHHPLWNPKQYTRHDQDADTLIEMMAELELHLLLPPGTITYPRASNTLDLVWGNSGTMNRVVKCRIAREHDHGSDHLPIETIIAMRTNMPQVLLPYNYAKTDWERLNDRLKSYLSEPMLAREKVTTGAEVDAYATKLVEAIRRAVEETTPRKRPCPHSKRWWTGKLTKLRREANKLRNMFFRTRHEADKAAWRAKKNEHKREIAQAKVSKWREYVSNVDGKTIFQVKDYVTNIPTSAVVPTLEGSAVTNEQKAAALKKAFFPKPPPADLSDIASTTYPQEVPYEHQITIRQIREAVNRLAPNKAPGPDEIANRVLKETLPVIERHLQVLMQASLDLGHYPKPFKHTTTVVLRKPSKPDYTKVKAYRPIALESTIGKIMESVIAEIMGYLTEEHRLLPTQHYGGRPGKSAEDAMMTLSEDIYQAWKDKKIFTTMFMDVAGAFNNVHHKRLIHDLRKRCIPEGITRWIASFLQGRSTLLQFNSWKSGRILTPAGVPQGSPLSPLWYMYYNADLLDIAPQHQAASIGFIDDVVYGVSGNSDKGNVRKLRLILDEAERWRKSHGAQFEVSKYVLVHFTRNNRLKTDASITVNRSKVTPSDEAKYLGVVFDRGLRFGSHLQLLVKRGTNAAMALASIAKSSWGAPYRYVRQLFLAVIAPSTDYGAIVWHRPKYDGSTATSAQIRRLTTIQRLAMKAILGCYRTTPTAAMEMESGLEPAWIRLQTKVLLAVTRMQSLSARHPMQDHLASALRTRTANVTHRSNFENILQQFPCLTGWSETIEPYIRPPWWVPKVKIKIEATKDNAKDQHDEICERPKALTVAIYTDGSGIENKIGAAAYNSSANEVGHQHLGDVTQFNVYAAELTALHLAVQQIQNPHEGRVHRIFTDSQAALRAIDHPRRQSGQMIIKDILDCMDSIADNNPDLWIEMVWVPGHSGIEGNERADAEAKRAALDQSLSKRFAYKALKSARVMHVKTIAKEQWRKVWNGNTKTASALRRIMEGRYAKNGLKLYSKLSDRDMVAKIVQLRTGHCGLNHYLHRFSINDTPYCECGYGKETVEHFLLECRRYKEQRRTLRREVGVGKMRVDRLLGDPMVIKKTLEYVKSTGRLKV